MQSKNSGVPLDSGRIRAPMLWAVFLVPLAAWMIQLFALYMLEDFISCTPGSQTPGFILGLGIRPLALGITGVLGLVTAAAGLLSFRLWRKMTAGTVEHSPAEKWMAVAGMMQGVLFLAIILIKAAPPLILGVCQF